MVPVVPVVPVVQVHGTRMQSSTSSVSLVCRKRVPNSRVHSRLACNNLACLYADRGHRLDRALELALLAVKLAPGNASVADTLVTVLIARDEPKRAREHIDAALNRDAPPASVLLHAARVFDATGEAGRAADARRRAADTAPARK